jgi:hypothetical protein
LNNPNFNYGGFAIIKNKAGLNNYKISVKEWIEQTNAIGLVANSGRYGGTFAHVDIALNLACGLVRSLNYISSRNIKDLKK